MAAPVATPTPAGGTESVQCFGRKKTTVSVELVKPEILRFMAYKPILLLGRHRFAGIDMRIIVKGGHTSQIWTCVMPGLGSIFGFWFFHHHETMEIWFFQIWFLVFPDLINVKMKRKNSLKD
ncbi:hypothetical protein Dsin_015287 [Dipteronia sinensis]|uniref:Uncharacterized protein n=1 Tax=Dipteronia sinensis TaxID=43782 RepID=A0AAE0AAY8_9ROSI|nr:hypothetical protein Dsin_015287 [Dipteronia sinensis]